MLRVTLLLASWVVAVAANVLATAQGKVRGVAYESHISYNGIPYASIADGDGRFKGAGLAPVWLGIREAPQNNCRATSAVEDCLRLDVHVPLSSSSPSPVLVWVAGSSGQFYPGKLVQQGIIVVVVHHRLGPVGFICLREYSIPGNAGAKDVVLALRWVRDNIVAFRGNPAKVTVAGQGYGAAMVEALMLSPIAKGLYHGVILQSGTTLSPLVFNYDAKDRALKLARTFRSSGNATRVLLATDIEDLVEKSEKIDEPYFPFGLCIEKAFGREEQMLLKAPYDLLTNKQVNSVPMIMGYNSDEACIFASHLKHAKVLRKLSRDMAFVLPDELKLSNRREKDEVLREIEDSYFHNNLTMASVLAYHRDAYFVNHIHRSARLHALASHHPVYYYQFSHAGFVGVEPDSRIHKAGAAHSDELAYLFPRNGRSLSGEDGGVQENLVKIWTNFVKHLNPTPRQGELSTTWEPLTPHDPRLLSIGVQVAMIEFPHKKAMRMWDDVFERCYYGRNRG